MFKDLQKLKPEIITQFRNTGTSVAISKPLQVYIQQLDKATEIYQYEHNITRAARQLQNEFPELALNTCRKRLYDAINYFHLNNSVKEEAWYMYYADRFEDLAKAQIAADNLDGAAKCMEKAADFRAKASRVELDPEDLKIKDFIISPDVSNERLGIPDFDLHDLWNESVDLIKKFKIDRKEKNRIQEEAALTLNIPESMIEDLDPEDYEEESN